MASQDSSARLIEALQSYIASVKRDSQLRNSGVTNPLSPADHFERFSTLKKEADLLNRAAQYNLAERVALAKLSTHVPAPTTPLLGLPSELLSHIFEIGCINPRPNSKPDEYDAFRGAISATCRAFRSILLKSPRCWTTIKYRGVSSPHTRLEQHIPLLLDRSQNCVIRICIYLVPRWNESIPYDMISVLLRPHLGRCIWLDIEAENFLAIERDFRNMPRLRHTRISYRHSKSTPFRAPPWIIQENSILQSLWIDASMSQSLHTESFGGLRGATLTELCVRGQFPNEAVLELLPQCSALEHLYWHSWDHIAVTRSTALGFPHLTRLDINSHTGIALRSLDAPELRELLFHREYNESGSSTHSFFHTDKQFPRLQTLQLVSYEDEDLILTFILRHRNIREIHLFPARSTPAAATRRITGFLSRFVVPLPHLSLAVPESVWKSHYFHEMVVCIEKLLTRLDETSMAFSYAEIKDSDYAKGKVPVISTLLERFPGRIQIVGTQHRKSLWWT